MNFTSNQQILICIIIAIIIIFLFYNRSEDFATSTEAVNNLASLYNSSNLTATNINATGAAHFTGFGTDTWLPASDGRNYIRGPLNIDGDTTFTKSATFNSGVKIPLDMTMQTAGQVSLWKDESTKGNQIVCPDGYYMAGIKQHWEDPQVAFFPLCRKLPGA
jgi:hypothetical protein